MCFALYGLVSYSGSLTLTSSGRYKIHWLNFILKVVAAILAAWLAKFLTSLLALLTNVYVANSVLVYYYTSTLSATNKLLSS